MSLSCSQMATGHNFIQDSATALVWLERALPIAERLDLLESIAAGLARLSGTLWRIDRQQESLILLRGAHQLAVENDLVEVHRSTRTSLSFREQFADPRAGLALAREGLEIASRSGSTSYGFMMVGNAMSCALRAGEWDWATALLEDWLANEITGAFYLELYADRAVLTALRGDDPSSDLADAERLVVDFMGDPQYPSYISWARAWAALSAGRLEEAMEHARASADRTGYFVPISLPIAARAALWAGDAATARELIVRIEASLIRGQAIGLDLATLRAGVAALEGRRAEAIAGYRDVLRGWRQLGLAFDEALAALDMAILLAPTAGEMAEAPTAIDVGPRDTGAARGSAVGGSAGCGDAGGSTCGRRPRWRGRRGHTADGRHRLLGRVGPRPRRRSPARPGRPRSSPAGSSRGSEASTSSSHRAGSSLPGAGRSG